MPLGFGPSGTITSSVGGDLTGGRSYTRIQGPLLVGSMANKAGWPIGVSQPPHVANVSTQLADTLISAAGGGVFQSSASGIGFLYMSQTTYTLSSSTAGTIGPTPTPAVAGGAAIVWDSLLGRLSVYSTVQAVWKSILLTSS